MMITVTELKMYNFFKEKGLLKNENLICKEVAIHETTHEVESCSDYDSDLSENSVTASNESKMTDLAGLFAESEIEVPEMVRDEDSLFTIISRILFLAGQEFIKSKNFLQTIWLLLFTLSLILNPSTNIPVATMLIPAVMCLYLPLRKAEKVEQENWKPPDPWVYSNKENIYVSDLESDIEETYSNQGYIRQRGRRKKKPEPSYPPWTHSGFAPV